jgi:hypothetical protein
VAEQPEAEPNDRVGNADRAGDGVVAIGDSLQELED